MAGACCRLVEEMRGLEARLAEAQEGSQALHTELQDAAQQRTDLQKQLKVGQSGSQCRGREGGREGDGPFVVIIPQSGCGGVVLQEARDEVEGLRQQLSEEREAAEKGRAEAEALATRLRTSEQETDALEEKICELEGQVGQWGGPGGAQWLAGWLRAPLWLSSLGWALDDWVDDGWSLGLQVSQLEGRLAAAAAAAASKPSSSSSSGSSSQRPAALPSTTNNTSGPPKAAADSGQQPPPARRPSAAMAMLDPSSSSSSSMMAAGPDPASSSSQSSPPGSPSSSDGAPACLPACPLINRPALHSL